MVLDNKVINTSVDYITITRALSNSFSTVLYITFRLVETTSCFK